jgi:hypothetical protein
VAFHTLQCLPWSVWRFTLSAAPFLLSPQGGRTAELLGHIRSFLDHRQAIEAHWRTISPDSAVAQQVASIAGPLLQQRRLADGAAVQVGDDAVDVVAGIIRLWPEVDYTIIRLLMLGDPLLLRGVQTLDELYEVAQSALPELEAALKECVVGMEGAEYKLAPLKQRDRAAEKARGKRWEGRSNHPAGRQHEVAFNSDARSCLQDN